MRRKYAIKAALWKDIFSRMSRTFPKAADRTAQNEKWNNVESSKRVSGVFSQYGGLQWTPWMLYGLGIVCLNRNKRYYGSRMMPLCV